MIRDDDILAWSAGLSDDDPLKEALKELLVLRKAFSEPYGYTDKDAHGMVYEPRHKDRLRYPVAVYRKPNGMT